MTSTKNKEPPMVLVMRRISIRNYPNGQKVALYKIDALGQTIAIPIGGDMLYTTSNTQWLTNTKR